LVRDPCVPFAVEIHSEPTCIGSPYLLIGLPFSNQFNVQLVSHLVGEIPVCGTGEQAYDVYAVLGEDRAAYLADLQRRYIPLFVTEQCAIQLWEGSFGYPTYVARSIGKTRRNPNLSGYFDEIFSASGFFSAQSGPDCSDVDSSFDFGSDPFHLYLLGGFRDRSTQHQPQLLQRYLLLDNHTEIRVCQTGAGQKYLVIVLELLIQLPRVGFLSFGHRGIKLGFYYPVYVFVGQSEP
jgi:hypothetical protein